MSVKCLWKIISRSCLTCSISCDVILSHLRRYMVKPQEDKRLVSLSLQQFVKSVGARMAAPGGGSVSAAVAALVWKNKTKHPSE